MRSSAEILVSDPNKHNKLPEVRFEFTFILSSKPTMAVFQANHGPYSNPDTRARLRTSHNSRNLTKIVCSNDHRYPKLTSENRRCITEIL